MTELAETAFNPVHAWSRRRDTQVLVIGAGIAGLSMTLRLPPEREVVVVTKGVLGESNTWYAQGGLAAAVGPDDDPDLHFADTIAAGAGLCDEDTVRSLVEGGPAAVKWLLAHGTSFDSEDGHLALGREAAHSRHRVLHAGGDATGAEIERSLVAQLRARPAVTILDHTTAIDIVHNDDGSCGGAIVHTQGTPEPILIAASATVLANGGAGQLWAVTSNPPGATGDGVAMALRAAVDVADLEFTQFHPTVLALPGHGPFLVTEAIRGEGAYLRSVEGDRFMTAVHPMAELAPRDVVARAIQDQIMAHRGQPVALDLRHLDADMVYRRFPTIARRLDSMGLKLASDLIPVAPAAHYFMGGIVADVTGRTSMDGLFAIGEVSCTGVHGANRLASNSLLEGLVFGLNLGGHLAGSPLRRPDSRLPRANLVAGGDRHGSGDAVAGARAVIQEIMSAHVSVVRDASGMEAALLRLDGIGNTVVPPRMTGSTELRNLYLLAREVTRSALGRNESRGAHFRGDFPERNPGFDQMHQVVRRDDGHFRRAYGPLHQPGGVAQAGEQ